MAERRESSMCSRSLSRTPPTGKVKVEEEPSEESREYAGGA